MKHRSMRVCTCVPVSPPVYNMMSWRNISDMCYM